MIKNSSNNKELLKTIMKEHNLTARDVADLLNVQRNRVHSWLTDSNWNRRITNQMIELLLIKINNQKLNILKIF